MQGRFLPGAGTGAFVLLPETAENGDASGYPENPAGQMTGAVRSFAPAVLGKNGSSGAVPTGIVRCASG